MENEHNIDNHLRHTLERFEARPELRSFDAIVKKMEQKKRRKFFIVFFGAGLALILGMLLYLPYLSAPAGAWDKTIAKKQVSPVISPAPAPTHKNKQDSEEKDVLVKPSQDQRMVTDSFMAPGEKHKIISGQNSLALTMRKKNIATASVNKINKTNAVQNASSLLLKKKTRVINPGALALADSANPKAFNPPVNIKDNSFATLTADSNASHAFYLPLIYIMIGDSINPDVTPAIVYRENLASLIKPDSLLTTKKKRKTNFYIGINLNPQWSSFAFSKNPNRDPIYDQNAGEAFSKVYLKNRKNQNTFRFNYAFGLKLGMVTRGGYEWLAGFGMQYYDEKEKLYNLAHGPKAPSGLSNVLYNSAPDPNVSYKNSYSYLYYSLECSRVFSFGMFSKGKIGLGIRANSLLSASYISVKSPDVYFDENYTANDLSKWLYTLHLKAGYIKDLNKRFQFQVNPGIFYSPNSMFNKNYVIKQKPVGFELECLLLFKLF